MKKGNMNKWLWIFLFAWLMSAPIRAQVTINLSPATRGAAINKLHYGIFYEEINHAGDGGLYAELIRNRSVEDNPNHPDFWWNVGDVTTSLTTSYPLNSNNIRSMKVEMRGVGSGVRNEGWWGIDVTNGRTYDLTLWINGGDQTYEGNITAQLQNISGVNLGEVIIEGPFEKGWNKYTAQITATGTDEKGWLALLGSAPGTIYYDFVSLFPPTYKGRENGCRIDLAEKLEALRPAFMRFPGGCYIEGNHTPEHPGQNRFEWKKTIGPVEERPGHFNNNWFYSCTDGLGFHEMLQLSEDLGAEPMFVVNMGFGHNWEDDINNIDVYIQEALDAIEYCNGDVDTKWGKVRAENGHPEPFNLRLLEIGNENYWFGSYSARYKLFYEAIRAKYPYIFFIANGGYQYGNPWPADVVDDHYYNAPSYFVNHYHMFDDHHRADYKVYVGEYAVTENFGTTGNMNAALGEAIYMMGMENNSDVVIMNSYAPIFTNENNVLWRPDMIRFNSAKSFGTPSYWVQQMMANYHGWENIRWTEEGNLNTPYSMALSSWGTSVKYDNIVVKDKNGKVLYENDFSDDDLSDWNIAGGSWKVTDGMLTQTSTTMYGDLALLKNQDFGRIYTIELDAVKVRGDEGFLIGFHAQDSKNYTWWNLGGWGNTGHALEQTLHGVKSTVTHKDGSLTTGTTYKLKIEVNSGWVRTFINNELNLDKGIMPNERKLYLSSNICDDSEILYVKVANPYDTKQKARFNLNDGRFTGYGQLHLLTSPSGNDENTIFDPNKVTPTTIDINVEEDGFEYDIPAYSLCIFALEVEDAGAVHEIVDVPEPLVSYSFETNDKKSDVINGVSYGYSIMGDGEIIADGEENHCFYSSTKGYLSMGSTMPKKVLAQLSTEYSISLRLKMVEMSNVDAFCWAWALADGTSNYMGLVNSPGNNNWYYEVTRASSGRRADTWSGLGTGVWHDFVITYNKGVTSIYMDGQLVTTSTEIRVRPCDIAGNISQAFLGKSPFGGDKLLINTCFDDFRVFNVTLNEKQVKALYQGRENITGIHSPVVSQPSCAQAYDLLGRPVSSSHKGFVIADGKKQIRR